MLPVQASGTFPEITLYFLHLVGQNCVTWSHKVSLESAPYFASHPIGQNCVTWPPLLQKRLWRASVSVRHTPCPPQSELFP